MTAEWKLIATAPKDGTKILLYGDWAGEINGCGDRHVVLVGSWLFGGRTDYLGYEWRVAGTDALAAWMRATHWMPLPEPPK